MVKPIEIPGVGIVNFPDEMDNDAIGTAIQTKIIPQYQRDNAPSLGERIGQDASAGIDRYQGGLYRAGQTAAQGLGFDDAATWFGRQADEQRQQAAATDTYDARILEADTFGEGVEGAAEAVVENAPQMAIGLGGAGAGALAGSAFGPFGTIVGALLGGAAASYPSLVGENAQEQIDRSGSIESPGAAAGYAVPQAALDSFIGLLIPGARGLGGGMISRGIKAAGLGAATEAPTELAQDALTIYQAGGDPTAPENRTRLLESALIGGIMGGGVGGVTGTVLGPRSEKADPETGLIDPATMEQADRENVLFDMANDPEAVEVLRANGIDPTDPEFVSRTEAQNFLNRIIQRRNQQLSGVVSNRGRTAVPRNVGAGGMDPAQARAEMDAIASGQLDPNAANVRTAPPEQLPGVIELGQRRVDDRATSGTNLGDQGLTDAARLRGEPGLPVVTEAQPNRMTPGEIARARAQNNRQGAGPSGDTLRVGGERLPQTRDDIESQRQSDQAMRLADMQRRRSGETVRDTRAAGRPQGGVESQEQIVLDQGAPVRILRTEQNPRTGKISAEVERYDPRTGASESQPYVVDTEKLTTGRYAQDPRSAQEFESAARPPSIPGVGRADEALGMPRQTYRTTEEDPMVAGQSGPASPMGPAPRADRPFQGEGAAQDAPGGPGRGFGARGRTSAEDIYREFEDRMRQEQEAQARGEQTESQTRAERAQSRYEGMKATGQPKGKDRDGGWVADEDGYVTSKGGAPITFAKARGAADWAQKNQTDRWQYDIAPHPTEERKTGLGGKEALYTVTRRQRPNWQEPVAETESQPDMPEQPTPPKARPRFKNAEEELRAMSRTGRRPQTLSGWIRSIGGIDPADPLISDVRAITDKAAFRLTSNPARSETGIGGRPLDTVREMAVERGFLPEGSTIPDLLEALDQDTAAQNDAGRVYSEQDVGDVTSYLERQRNAEAAERELADTDLTRYPNLNLAVEDARSRADLRDAIYQAEQRAGDIREQRAIDREDTAFLDAERQAIQDQSPLRPRDVDEDIPFDLVAPTTSARTEATPQGEQRLVEGVAPVADADRVAAGRNAPMRGGNAPVNDGLFDVAGRGQGDLLENPIGDDPNNPQWQATEQAPDQTVEQTTGFRDVGRGERTSQKIDNGVYGTVRPELTEDGKKAADAALKVLKRIAPRANSRLFENLTDENGNVKGFGVYLNNVINLALDSPDIEGTARHEAIHFLKETGAITPKQWAVLVETARKNNWAEEFDIVARYERIGEKLTPEQVIEESIAEAYTAWANGDLKLAPQGNAVMRALQRIFERVRGAVREALGYDPDYKDIFSRVESGKADRGPRVRNVSGVEAAQGMRPQAPGLSETPTELAEARPDAVRLFQSSAPARNRANDISQNPVFRPTTWQRLWGSPIKDVAQAGRNLMSGVDNIVNTDSDRGVMNRMSDLPRLLFLSNIASIESVRAAYKDNAPAQTQLNKILKTLGSRAGSGEYRPQGYEEGVDLRYGMFSNDLLNALGPAAEDEGRMRDIRRILQGTSSGATNNRAPAKRVRKVLDDIHAYMKAQGLDVGYAGPNYFTRMIDRDAVLDNREAFIDRATQVYQQDQKLNAEDARIAANAWFRNITMGRSLIGNVGGGIASGTNITKERVFKTDAPERLLSEFYEQDPLIALREYTLQAARRGEYAKRFYRDGKDILPEMMGDLQKTGLDGSAYRLVENAVLASLGRNDYSGDIGTTAASWLQTIGTLTLLPRATLTSLAEPATVAARTGRGGDAFSAFGSTLKEVASQIRGNKTKDRQFAEAMGIVSSALNDMILQSRFGGAVESKFQQNLTANYFRKIGLHDYTMASRVAATKLGRGYIKSIFDDLDTHPTTAQEILNDLGISVEDVPAMRDWLNQNNGLPDENTILNSGELGEKYQAALTRFARETIQAPTAAERPRFATHPIGRMIYGLTSFLYGFGRNIVGRAARMSARGLNPRSDLTKAERAQNLAPLAGVAAMIALHSVVSEMREQVFNNERNAERTLGEKAMLGVSRSGVLGPADLVLNAVTGLKYQRDLANLAVGPGPGFFLQQFQDILGLYTHNSENTNTAERNALKGAYGLTVMPALTVMLGLLPPQMGLIPAGIAAFGVAQGTSPSAREWAADAIIGKSDAD